MCCTWNADSIYFRIFLHYVSSVDIHFINVCPLCVPVQRGEHVCHADRYTTLHCGALQPEGLTPEDGGQGNEPPTCKHLLR